MKSGNKGLVILLCVLGVVIVGLGVGIGVLNINKEQDNNFGVETEAAEEIAKVVSQWQNEIDSAQTEQEKFSAYISVAMDLDNMIVEKEGDESVRYCETLLEYSGKANEFATDEGDELLVKAVRARCVAEESSVSSQSITDTGGGAE